MRTPLAARFGAAGALLVVLAAGGWLAASDALQAQDGWQLPGLSGGSLSSSDVASGATVMILFAGWSPHCRDIVARSNAVAQRWGGAARVVLVDFQEEPADVSAFLAGKGSHAPVFLDGDGTFAKRHRVTTLPGLVVYRDGAAAFQGKLPADPDEVLGGLLR
jgi:thiol-disulfide isomerase/thioredoxin